MDTKMKHFKILALCEGILVFMDTSKLDLFQKYRSLSPKPTAAPGDHVEATAWVPATISTLFFNWLQNLFYVTDLPIESFSKLTQRIRVQLSFLHAFSPDRRSISQLRKEMGVRGYQETDRWGKSTIAISWYPQSTIGDTVKPRYNVPLGTRIFQRYIEINVISREFYMGVYVEGPENTNVITR
jgi:hypothetical protein